MRTSDHNTSLLVCLATCAIALGLFAGASPAFAIDLTAPERSITDPLADVRPLDRNCSAQQVDVNTASASEIATALKINSRPTIDRVIGGRPWLKATDIVSVPGIPPSAGSRIAADACATPTTLPLPTPLACVTDTIAVDLQSASATEITSRLGLPRSTVDSLIAARPLPQDLHQVATPRVTGLADPKIDRLVNDGAVCVTPAPFTFAAKTWRWASQQYGVVVADATDARYALIVPPGTAAGPTGIWGTVTQISGTLPSASLHLYGSWSGEVGARLPDPADRPAGRPAVQHNTSTGDIAFSWGDNVARESAGTIVAALSSLSTVIAMDLSPLCLPVAQRQGIDQGAFFCAGDSPRDTSAVTLVKARGAYAGRYAARFPAPGPCGVAIAGAISSGKLPFSLNCGFESSDSTNAAWRISNGSGVSEVGGLVTVFGTLALRFALGNHEYETPKESVQVEGRLYGLVGKEVAKLLVQHTNRLLPGTSLTITKRRGSGPSSFRQQLDNDEWADMWALFHVLEIADAGFDVAGVRTFGQLGLADCVNQIAGSEGAPDLAAIKTCVFEHADLYLQGLEDAANFSNDKSRARTFASIRAGLKIVTRALSLADLAASYSVQISASVASGSEVLTLEYLSPPPPAGSGIGGLSGNGTFIARTAARKGYLVDPSAGTARSITNGGDFLCYARNRYVIDLVKTFSTDGETTFLHLDPAVEILDANPAPACTAQTVGPGSWTFTAPPHGNTPFNVILKGAEDGGVDSAWLINSRGQIQTIPDGGTYECLVHANPVIWNVPFAAIQAWRPVGTTPASCGPS